MTTPIGEGLLLRSIEKLILPSDNNYCVLVVDRCGFNFPFLVLIDA